MLTKDDSSPVRAAASRVLASDPYPKSGESLVTAVSHKSWIVRMATLDSLARRGDPTVIPQIVPNLEDSKASVRYTAAAAILRLAQTKK
jgi:HEAT repeat protein